MVILIAVVVILLTIVVALILGAAVKGLDTAVITKSETAQKKDRTYNPAATLGYSIQVDGDQAAQIKEAKILAAKQAAATPRGANVQIGPQYKQAMQRTAFDGLDNDPVTAVKIAAVHGWDGIRTGMVAVDPSAVAAAAASTPAAGGATKLVPGKDYPVIEITDTMPADEKRKALIANAKAKSAAMKTAKAAQESGGGVVVAGAASAAVGVAAAPAVAMPSAAAAAAVPEPAYIEITADMSPEETRKARIANSKTKSVYNKALKAAGVDTSAPVPAAAPAPAPLITPAAAPVSAAVGIPQPMMIEVTDDMSPDDIRKARIANSKAKSAYNKALKAAGIDPSGVD